MGLEIDPELHPVDAEAIVAAIGELTCVVEAQGDQLARCAEALEEANVISVTAAEAASELARALSAALLDVATTEPPDEDLHTPPRTPGHQHP